MATTDPRIDAYIDAAADFAKPILGQLRAAVHDGCPGAVETIKWGFPHFMHGGGILCYMAAFKQHCSFGFRDPKHSGVAGGSQSATDQFGRIKSLQDLPAADALRAAVARAVAAIDQGGKVAAPRRAAKPAAETPADLQAALQAEPAALASSGSAKARRATGSTRPARRHKADRPQAAGPVPPGLSRQRRAATVTLMH
jgi:hypothetical protein